MIEQFKQVILKVFQSDPNTSDMDFTTIKEMSKKIGSKDPFSAKINELKIIKEFTPKQGTIIFFKSTPNSYHGVKRFKEFNCPKRFFIYGVTL